MTRGCLGISRFGAEIIGILQETEVGWVYDTRGGFGGPINIYI